MDAPQTPPAPPLWQRLLRPAPFTIAPFAMATLFSIGQSYHYLTYRPPGATYPYGLPGYDENGYFSHAHTIAFDGDLDYRNQYRMIARRQGDDATGRLHLKLAEDTSARGRPENFFPAGSGVLGVPALLQARAVDWAASVVRNRPLTPPEATLWVWIHLSFQAMLGFCGAVATLALSRRVLASAGPRADSVEGSAAVATVLAIAAGPAIYYWLHLPGMAHLAGWALASAALLLWWSVWPGTGATGGQNGRQPVVVPGLICGLCIGLAACVRPYNLPLVLIGAEPLARAIALAAMGRGQEPRHWRAAVFWAVASGIGAVIGFLPQMLVWHGLHGTLLANTQGWKLQIPPPHALQVLFSPRHGLFYWAPFLLAVFPGLWLMMRRGGAAARAAWLIIGIGAGWLLMAGSWRVWWLGVAFGMRGAVDLTALLAVPVGFAVHSALGAEKWRRPTLLLAALAIALNLLLSIAFRSGSVWTDGPLQWSAVLSKPERIRALLRTEFDMWTHWTSAHRHPLTAPPPKQ